MYRRELPDVYDQNVALYGMMLAGKSTVGRKLSERLWLGFVDLDDFVVDHLWVESISEFIAERTAYHGGWERAWDDFAWVERECIQEITSADEKRVIALGGRTVFPEENRRLITETQGLIRYYLELDFRDQYERWKKLNPEELANRPQCRTAIEEGTLQEFFAGMQKDRRAIYEEFSDWNIIHVGGRKVSVIVDELLDDIYTKRAA